MVARIRALFAPVPPTQEEQILREWRALRGKAISRNDELEIDGFFSRALDELEVHV